MCYIAIPCFRVNIQTPDLPAKTQIRLLMKEEPSGYLSKISQELNVQIDRWKSVHLPGFSSWDQNQQFVLKGLPPPPPPPKKKN